MRVASRVVRPLRQRVPCYSHSALNPKELAVQVASDARSVKEHLARPCKTSPLRTRHHTQYALLETLAGMAKVYVGSFGNIAMTASGLHSLSAAAFSASRIFAKRYSLIPADAAHPYGHAKIEGALAAAASLGMMYAALKILHSSLSPAFAFLSSLYVSSAASVSAVATPAAAAGSAAAASTSTVAASAATLSSFAFSPIAMGVCAFSCAISVASAYSLRDGSPSERLIAQRSAILAVCTAAAMAATATAFSTAPATLPAAAVSTAAAVTASGPVVGTIAAGCASVAALGIGLCVAVDSVRCLRDSCRLLLDSGVASSDERIIMAVDAAQRVVGVKKATVFAARDVGHGIDIVIHITVGIPRAVTVGTAVNVVQEVQRVVSALDDVSHCFVEVVQ